MSNKPTAESYVEYLMKVLTRGVKQGIIGEAELEEGTRLAMELMGDVSGGVQKFTEGLEALKLTASAGSTNSAIVLNGGLVAAGLYTGGNSAVQYAITTNPAAKKCYFLSVVFSMSAVGNGGFAVLSKTCHLSSHGVLSEALGAGLMWCGNACQVAALKAEGKPIPPKLQQSLKRKPRIFGQNGNGVAFTMPVASTISFQKLATIIGISITVYSYSKLVIKAYRYGQQFITNYKKEKHSSLSFRTRVEFIVISFHKCSSVRRVNGIYSFAISY